MADDGRYLVPSLDSAESDHQTALFLIADDRRTLQSRVRQLLGKAVWSENPRSRTRRLVTNVRMLEATGQETRVTANFAVWRFQHEQTDVYVGRYLHVLIRGGPAGLLFRERKAVLDLDTLRPHGCVVHHRRPRGHRPRITAPVTPTRSPSAIVNPARPSSPTVGECRSPHRPT